MRQEIDSEQSKRHEERPQEETGQEPDGKAGRKEREEGEPAVSGLNDHENAAAASRVCRLETRSALPRHEGRESNMPELRIVPLAWCGPP
jgi:hypothetical protein